MTHPQKHDPEETRAISLLMQELADARETRLYGEIVLTIAVQAGRITSKSITRTRREQNSKAG